MTQIKQYSIYSGRYIGNLCKLVINDKNNAHFIMQGVAKKIINDNGVDRTIPVTMCSH